MDLNTLKKVMAYFGTPLLYCVICFVVTLAAIYPFTRDIASAASIFISDSAMSDTAAADGDIVALSDITGGIIAGSDVRFPDYGENVGTISFTGESGINTKLYFGDNNAQLSNGVGIFAGSSMPGYGSTVLIAGHNHTFFKPLKYAAIGDIVTITTYYGVYSYEIYDIQVKQEDDETHYDLLADHENLLLYTCYPFGSIGMTPTRYFLYGRYISGPMINIKQ